MSSGPIVVDKNGEVHDLRVERGRRGRDLIKFLFAGNYLRVRRNNVNVFVNILVVIKHNKTTEFKTTNNNINSEMY